MSVALRDAVAASRLSLSQLAKGADLAKSTVHRLIHEGIYPARTDRAKVREAIARALSHAGFDGEVRWPDAAQGPQSPLEEINWMLDRQVLRHFGLASDPFVEVADHGELYETEGFRRVRTSIIDTIEGRGIVVLTSPSGAGKTTLWNSVRDHLDHRDATVIRVHNMDLRNLTPDHLVRALIHGILGDVSVKANAEARGRQVVQALHSLRTPGADQLAVLVIDDAHFANDDVLKSLKRFYEERVGRLRLLSIVLVGLPTLRQRLGQFVEVGFRSNVCSVPMVKVESYLQFKLSRIGARVDQLFDESGTAAFLDRFRETRKHAAMGYPLVINAAAKKCMSMLLENAAGAGERISAGIVDRVQVRKEA